MKYLLVSTKDHTLDISIANNLSDLIKGMKAFGINDINTKSLKTLQTFDCLTADKEHLYIRKLNNKEIKILTEKLNNNAKS